MFLWSNYLCNKYRLSACYVPGSLPVAGDTAGNKTEISAFQEADILERRDSEQEDKDKLCKSSL